MRSSLILLLFMITSTAMCSEGFVPNVGQFVDNNSRVLDADFKLTLPGANAYFTPNGVVYHFYRTEKKDPSELDPGERTAYSQGDLNTVGEKVYFYRIDFKLTGHNTNADVVMEEISEFRSNYYLAHCPEGITEVPSYGKAVYRDIYENIDLIYRLENGRLKYEFIVYPGGDPSDIRFTYDGSDAITISDGELIVSNDFHDIREHRPYSYLSRSKATVTSEFRIEEGHVGFEVGDYRANETLVIDPAVTWSTYYDNGGNSDFHANSVYDPNGNLFVAYATYSNAWLTINAGAGQYYDGMHEGISDVVVARFDADMSKQWATYYGGDEGDYLCGTGGDYGKTIDVDSNGDIYFAGYTNGNPTQFPTASSGVGGAWYQDDSNLKGGDNSFVIKFDPNGIRQWGTLYQHTNASTSGAGIRINGIKCNGSKVYFTGEASQFSGFDIPFVNLSGAYNQTTFVGSEDIILGRFSSDCVLEWSTYFNGGNASLDAFRQGADITFDATGSMILVGQISGTDPDAHYLLDPGLGAYFSNTISGFIDITVAKFNSSMQPIWSTIIGGTNLDRVSEVSTDDNDNILVACRMADPNMPTVDPGGGAYYTATQQSASNDGFIMKFDPNGVYSWGTYVGGTDGESSITGITADAAGNVYVVGYTSCTDFPVQSMGGSYNQANNAGNNDLVLMNFSSGGVNDWSTYYGGTGSETCYGRKIDLSSMSGSCGFQALVSLATGSSDYPTTDPGGSAFFEGSINPSSSTSNALLLIEDSAGSGSTPALGINIDQPSTCAGSTVTLNITGGSLDPADTWTWYEGGCGTGASIGTGDTIIVSPSTSTVYYVRAEGPCGNSTCASQSVSVTQYPDPSWSAPDTVCTADGTFDLNPFVTGDTGGTWSSPAVAGSNFNPIGFANSYVSVSYTVSNASCDSTTTQSIYVLGQMSAAWNAPLTICENDTIIDLTTMIVNDTGGVWSGPAVTGSMFDPAGLSGTITITYTVGSGSCGDTESHDIDIQPAPGDPVPSTSADTICQGESAVITATGAGAGASYKVFNSPTAAIPVGTVPYTASPSTTMTYYIETVSQFGCMNNGGRIPVTVVVVPAPNTIISGNTVVCPGEMTTLTVSGGISWLWSTGDTTASVNVTPMTDTFYVAEVSNGTCTGTDTAFVTLLSPGSVAAANDGLIVSSEVQGNVDVSLNDNGDPSTVVIIGGPGNGTATVSNGVISYTSDPGYDGTEVIDYVICDAVCGSNCDTAALAIVVQRESELSIPTGFTPNGDGINDAWVISGLDNYEQHELMVYNRWGDLVFSASPYNNDWEGRSQTAAYGETVIDGTYFYVLSLDSGDETRKGYVEVKSK